jgi:hypothetical protein
MLFGQVLKSEFPHIETYDERITDECSVEGKVTFDIMKPKG